MSVVIASYNRANLLPDCIATLRKSGVDLQIIVVDDGSKDNTAEVVRSLGSDILYIYQENQGLSAARNTGIRAADTQYIAYLDSDDYWFPDVAPSMLEILDQYPQIGAIFAESQVGNDEQGYTSWIQSAGTEEFQKLPSTDLRPELKLMESEPLYRLLIRRNVVFTGAIIQRRELVLKAGLFDINLKATGDWELWMRLLPLSPFAYYNKSLAIYTRHDDNMTNNQEVMQKAFCDTLYLHSQKNTSWYRTHQQLFETALRDHVFYYGYSAFKRGDYSAAFTRFEEGCKRVGFDSRLFLFKTVSGLPKPLIDMIRYLSSLTSR